MSIKKEEEIVKYISEYYQRTKFYPNFREISKAVNLQSNSTIHHYMKQLEDKGIVIRKADCSAQYRLNDMSLNNRFEDNKSEINNLSEEELIHHIVRIICNYARENNFPITDTVKTMGEILVKLTGIANFDKWEG